MSVKYSDLPPALKAQVDAQLGSTPSKPRRGATGRSWGRCACGFRCTDRGFEKHHDAHSQNRGPGMRTGHGRWAAELAELYGEVA